MCWFKSAATKTHISTTPSNIEKAPLTAMDLKSLGIPTQLKWYQSSHGPSSYHGLIWSISWLTHTIHLLIMRFFLRWCYCHTRPNLESNLTWILQDLTCKLGHEVVLFSARMTRPDRPDTSVSIAVELAICVWRVSERCFYVSGQWLSVYWCVSRPDPTPPDLTYYFQLLQNLQYDLRVSKKCSYVSGKSLNMSGMCFDVPRRRPSTFVERWPLLKDDFRWKMTLDNLRRKMTLDGRRP